MSRVIVLLFLRGYYFARQIHHEFGEKFRVFCTDREDSLGIYLVQPGPQL